MSCVTAALILASRARIVETGNDNWKILASVFQLADIYRSRSFSRSFRAPLRSLRHARCCCGSVTFRIHHSAEKAGQVGGAGEFFARISIPMNSLQVERGAASPRTGDRDGIVIARSSICGFSRELAAGAIAAILGGGARPVIYEGCFTSCGRSPCTRRRVT